MACVAMDTNFPDSPEAVELGRRLGLRLAWCHALRLWAWGIDQDREDGTIKLDDERIAAVSDWRGDPHAFVEAMVGVGLLIKQPDDSYYMAGWSRNKEYFAKKRRMREYRQGKKSGRSSNGEASPDTPRDTPQETSPDTARVPRSPSRSPSHRERDQGGATLEKLGEAAATLGVYSVGREDRERFSKLYPVGQDEIDHALEVAQRAKAQSVGYMLTVIERDREKAAEVAARPALQRTARRREPEETQRYREYKPTPPPTAAERAASSAAAAAARAKLDALIGAEPEVA